MFKHWKWLGVSLTALLVLGVFAIPPSEAKPKPKPPPEPPPGPITFSPEPGVVLTWIDPESSNRAFASFLDDNGCLVVAGDMSPGSDGSQDFAALRYLADGYLAEGTLDPTFGNGGAVTKPFVNGFSDYALAAAAYPGGRILLAGNANTLRQGRSDGDFALARFNADGSGDREFGAKGKNAGKVQTHLGGNDRLHGVAVQTDGSIVAAGSTNGIRSSTTNRASPQRLTSGRTILPNSAGSMSMWIFTASRQNSSSLPVMRSSQRAPIAMMRSQPSTARLA